jgi:imidazolonepropionase-like amidohydrolase
VIGKQDGGIAFVGGTLIDGTGAPPLAGSAIVVSDGRISWIGAASDLDRARELQLVDVSGKYVIPGLLDANVHLLLQITPDILLRYEPGCYDDLVVEAAQVALKAGITTVFDTWGPLESLRRVRDRINAGELTGSRIFFAGNIVGNGGPWTADFVSAFGDSLSPDIVDNINRHWEQGVGGDLTWMSADDVRAAVQEYIAASGIDFVKYASSAHALVRFIAFSPDAQRAIVEEAHAAGMTAQACTMTPEALKLAIEAGVDLLQHGDVTGRRPMPQETLDLIVARQLPCVAFLVTERNVAAATAPDKLRLMDGYFSQRTLVKDENDRKLIAAGAKLLMANDMGVFGPSVNTHPLFGPRLSGPDNELHLGRSHLFWFQAAIERGMTPMDALLSATRNIAQAYRKDDELGTVELGKRADLLVLDANPLDNSENYGRISHVVKDGELVDRERLPEHPVLTAHDQELARVEA